MKKIITLLVIVLATTTLCTAQTFRKTDASPLDVAYFPDNFAHDRKPGEKPIVKVVYSRPKMNGREIFGKLVPYGEVWRTGANEATEVKFYQDVTMGGHKVSAGTYSLFTIPGTDVWTIVLNKDLDYWGAYSYNQKNDVVRITASTLALTEPIEDFTIQFADKGNNTAVMQLAWSKTVVEVPFSY